MSTEHFVKYRAVTLQYFIYSRSYLNVPYNFSPACKQISMPQVSGCIFFPPRRLNSASRFPWALVTLSSGVSLSRRLSAAARRRLPFARARLPQLRSPGRSLENEIAGHDRMACFHQAGSQGNISPCL